MAIYNQRVSLTKEQLLGSYVKRDSILYLIYGIVRFIGIIIENLYCVSSYLVLSWIVLLPIGWVRSDLYSKAENYLYNSLLFIVSSWSLAAGATVVEAGDEYKHLIEDPVNDKQRQHELSYMRNTSNRNNVKSSKQPIKSLETHPNVRANGYNQHLSNHQDNLASNYNNTSKHQQYDHIPITRSSTKFKGSEHNSVCETNGVVEHTIRECNGKTDSELIKSENGLKGLVNSGKSTIVESDILRNNNNNNENHSNHVTARKSRVDNNGNKFGSNTENQQTISTLSDSLPSKGNQAKPRILLLCNHISTADVPLMMQAFSSLTNQSLLWVLDAQFKPTNFGVVCSSHGDFFVAKNSFVDGSLREQVLKHPDRNLLVLFPEGGFLRKRIDGSNRYATKNGLPLTTYVTHPRYGAFKDLIDPSVGVTHIVDATLLYDDIKNPLSILDIALGTRKEAAILHYKLYNRSEINPNEEWLRNIWLEKDKLLKRFYEDRASVYKQFDGTLRAAVLDWFKILAVHLFYLLVCYVAIFRLFNATSVTMLKARELYYSNI